MAKQKLVDLWACLYSSSSIANFKDKLLDKYKLPEWSISHILDNTIFFGAYHQLDWLRILLHRGKRTIFWCGADILALKRSVWRYIIPRLKAEHICENYVEEAELWDLGIKPMVKPHFFGNVDDFPISYKHSENPRVFATYHKGREEEYGYFEHPQVDWFSDLSEVEFNEKIKEYQGCIRLNEFDGFAESLAKSVLMGQYQYSSIYYLGMAHPEFESIEEWLESLKDKKEPNPWSKTWREILK